MKARATRAAALGAVSLYALGAMAYQRSEAQWDPRTLPIPYRVNPNSAPASLGATNAVAAIEQGMASWAAPTCTTWRASNVGTTNLTRASGNDRTNTFLWISGAWPAELGSVNVTIGVTTPVYIPGRYVIDADIQFNNVGFQWSTTGARGTVDAQSIATHEEGHFLGLDHTPDRSAVMFASYSGGLTRTLAQDDVNGVCALYPSGGAVPDAGVPTDPCARYTSCAGCTPVNNCGWCEATGRCQTGTSSGPSGSACGGPWRWDPRSCSSTTPVDAGATTDPCNMFTSCGTCTPVNGCGWCGSLNRCVRGTPTGPVTGSCTAYAWTSDMCAAGTVDAGTPGGTATFGEPCRVRTDCASGGLCVGATGVTPFCTRVCTDDCTCPRGYGCAGRLTTGQTVCVPGPNGCNGTEPTDAGSAPIDVVAPRDVVTPPRDVVTPRDVVAVTDAGSMEQPDVVMKPVVDAGAPAETDAGGDPMGYVPLTQPSSCGCATPGAGSSRGALLALVAGLAALATRRRRR